MKKTLTAVAAAIFAFLLTPAFSGQLPTGMVMYVAPQQSGSTCLEFFDIAADKAFSVSEEFNNIVYPRVSRDREVIGFTNKEKEMKSEIYLMFPKLKKIEKVLDNAALEDFSPSGNYLLYTKCDEAGGLFVYDIQKKTSKPISKDKIFSASWSNDSKWVAASVISKSGKSDLIKISLADFKVEKLTDTPAINEAFPVFTADGRYLAFYKGKDRKNLIAYYDIAARSVTETPIEGRNPSMSQDNFWVVYEKNNQIYISDKDGNTARKIATGKTPVWLP